MKNLKFLSGKELFISGDTIERHRDPNDTSANTHKEITPFDYSLISYMFENNAFIVVGKENSLEDECIRQEYLKFKQQQS